MGPAKECVTTHLSKKAVLKMDVAKTIEGLILQLCLEVG